MNPNHENELATAIDRELKALSPLAAPPELASRIMNALAEQECQPWYRAGWQNWPLSARAASFVALLTTFVGLCFAGWKVSQIESVTEAGEKVGATLAFWNLVCKTVGALADAALLVVHQVRTEYIIGALVLVAAAYALCIALGSFYLRFAWSRR